MSRTDPISHPAHETTTEEGATQNDFLIPYPFLFTAMPTMGVAIAEPGETAPGDIARDTQIIEMISKVPENVWDE